MKKNTLKRILALALAMIMVLSLAACGSKTSAEEKPAASGNAPAADQAPAADKTPAAEPAGEKVFRMAWSTEMDTMDISDMGAADTGSMYSLLVDSLVRLKEDGTIENAAAESYDVSDDGLVYTFKIRDMKWSNGDPLTANDFEFAWKRATNPENGHENSFLFNYLPIKNMPEVQKGEVPVDELGVTAVDEKTLVVELTTPCNWMLRFLCDCYFAPLNEKFMNECGDQYALNAENFVTCGAFTLQDWTAGDMSWSIEKDPTYWNADAINVDRIEYQIIKDSQTGIMAFESDTVDFVPISSELVELYRDNEAFVVAPTTYSWYIVPNFMVPELANQNLRYALGFAVDRDALANNVLGDGSLPKTDCNYSDVFFRDGVEFNSVREDFWCTDKEKAAQYWEAAKQELGIDSLALTLTLEDAESAQKVAAFYQSEIESTCPGLTIDLKVMPKSQRLADQNSGNFQLTLHRTGSSVPNIVAKLGQYTTGHNLNYGKWSSEEYDALYNKILNETDEETIWNDCLDLETMAQQSGVAIPLYRTAQCLLVRPGVTGWNHNLVGLAWEYKYVDIVG